MKASIGTGMGLPAIVSTFAAITGSIPWGAMFTVALLGIGAAVVVSTIPQDSGDKLRLWKIMLRHFACRSGTRADEGALPRRHTSSLFGLETTDGP
jgi:hypothetical protein